MKRTPPKVLQKRRITARIVLSISVVIALLLVLSPELFPSPSYDELYEKTVTISSCERIHQYRGGYSYRLYTEEDGTFTLTGKFDNDTVDGVLQSSVTATIKGYPNHLNPFLECAEEILVDGKMIVSYNNDAPPRPHTACLVRLVICFYRNSICRLQFVVDKASAKP